MDIKIYPSKLSGTVTAPPSKSSAHRAFICACLAKDTSTLINMGNNDDIIASLQCGQSLGATIHSQGQQLKVQGASNLPQEADFNCNESGSTLRFFTPIVCALGINSRFYGKGRLPNRPMEPLLSLLKDHGVCIDKKDGEIFSTTGQLLSGEYKIPGNISSQYISGLLFALPLLSDDSTILLTTPLESIGYIEMTIEVLNQFGISIETTETGYYIKGNQTYQSRDFIVEGDYSSAAFWLSAATLGHNIKVKGLSKKSLQADKDILPVLENFGANITFQKDMISIQATELKGSDIDGSNIPDSVPILSVVGALAKGNTRIYNAERLRIKESDRLESTEAGLRQLGIKITQTKDGLYICGAEQFTGGVIYSYGDHRIAMAMTIAAISAKNPVIILGAECVDKSYPNFYQDLKYLGGNFDVISVG